ncbi:hypothetical protein LJ221_22170, partial [Streptomyces sp. CNQ085]|nr:hypothetical protein [Streptomyces sp. CNQ085]
MSSTSVKGGAQPCLAPTSPPGPPRTPSPGVPGANLHDGQALLPLVAGIPAVRSRRAAFAAPSSTAEHAAVTDGTVQPYRRASPGRIAAATAA